MSRTIKVLSHDLEIRAEDGDRLSDRLLAAGIPVSLYCSNRGLCGKCFVEVAGGSLPPPGKKEAAWIGQKHLADNHRLACQFVITGDLEINVPAAFTVRPVPVLPDIPRSVVAPDPAVRLYEVELSRPEISSPDRSSTRSPTDSGFRTCASRPDCSRSSPPSSTEAARG